MEEQIVALLECLESLEYQKALLEDDIENIKKELKQLLDGK